ncbi:MULTISPECIES: adenylyl-sulfate kinase [Streptomyces]|uniref:Adenylyl-sulfate kinase n=1 Tax=Streptomyces salyersiae TaxID=3075530 RepID=A0ABU2RD29_9ACTN|nr:adenylyl-sulfate kinase [Streptomyces sp. DSM 41770]MDT0426776.1 adenylyl-sulfate kinase [Streptomyces sp. DSM 41770]
MTPQTTALGPRPVFPPAASPHCTCYPGATVWLTGLPSSGKTTLARATAEALRRDGRRAEVLDGDELRRTLTGDLGFSREDRHRNVERIGRVAQILARNGVLALVPVIAPYAESRERVRTLHRTSRTPFLEVHVAAPVAVCATRDVKGLYARQAAGGISGLTGVDAPYEEPLAPDLRIDSHTEPADRSAAALLALLAERGLA